MNTDGIQPPGGKRATPKETEFDDPGRLGRLKEQMYSRQSQPVSRPRREFSGLERDTPDDWVEQEPPKKPTSLLPRSYSLPSILLIVAALIFVIAGGFAVSFLISGSNVVTARKIDVAINGPRTIEGGEVLELQVSVRNNNAASLELADLVVTYPQGTRMPSNVGAAMETQRIPLGTIDPGGTRSGTIRAIMFGREGDRQDIHVALEYRLSGSSALFFAETKHTVLVSSGTLDIALTTNSQAVAGQTVDMTATVTSRASTVVKDVVLRASFPFGFAVTSTSPETPDEGFWALGDIEPGEKKTIRILGVLDGQTGDARVFRFLAGTRKTPESKVVDVVLADFEKKIAVERPFLGMSLTYNELPAAEYVGYPGETVPITLRWRNNLDVALSDVVVAATLSGTGLDRFNITADRGFYRSIDSVVLWDKTTTKGVFERVPAGEEGTLVIRLSPLATDNLLAIQNPTINIELHAAGQRLSEGSVPITIQASVKESIKIATQAGFEGRALYFENPLGSVGPLPPKVEHETTYGILWELSNTTNLVRDARVTAVLPPYVRWLGTVSPSVENVTFNENTGTVTWSVGKLLADTGVGDRAPRRVVFAVGLVPSTSQIGQTPALVQNQKLVGIDTFVDVPLEETANDLTTKLDETDFADVYSVIVR